MLSSRHTCFTSGAPKLFATLSLAALGLGAVHPAFAQTAVLTQNNDNARSGANTAETILTPQNVKTATFGKLFTITGLNANVNGQVLYVPGVTIGGAKHNVVYAYTSNNTDNSPCGVYAYDGDTGTQLWKTILPNSATYTTATPVIDPATNTMYVLTKTGNDNTGLTYLHAFDIVTGADKPGSPIQVQASAPGTGDGSVGGVVYFDGDHGNGRFHANDRAGLLFANGTVYAAFAHNSDSNPYHGWVLGYGYDGTQFTQKYVFCTTPNGSASTTPGGADGGVWQAGKGLTADSAGNIYFSVGNGTFDADKGGIDYGMCYMKLSPALQVLDWFAPFDQQKQSSQDLDLGNTGLAGIPGTTALFAGGTKFGTAFVLDSNNLGKFTANGPDNVLDRIDRVSGNDDVGQNPIAWDSGTYKYVYLWPGGQPLEQFQFDPSVGNLNPKGIFTTAAGVTNGGSLAVSSNGTASGILWAAGGNGVLRAYDATNVSRAELWDSGQNSGRDALGSVGHFQFPTVVNGKVYVPTNGATVAVYGLLPVAPPPAVTTATQARFVPRSGYEYRMIGGKFQGSNDGTAYTTLATITQSPVRGQYNTVKFASPAFYRYLRYLSPNNGYGNIAELEFDGASGTGVAKISGTPFGTAGSWANSGNTYVKAFDGSLATFFDAATGNNDFAGIDQGKLTPVLQINAGSGAAGTFAADTDVSGGNTFTSSGAVSTQGVADPAPQAVYQSERYGNFTYTLPNLTPGASYTLRLHFAEIFWSSTGQRVFNVSVNNAAVLSNFDIVAAAGGANKAIVETFPATADSSGKITVTFTTVKDNAKLSGLELLH